MRKLQSEHYDFLGSLVATTAAIVISLFLIDDSLGLLVRITLYLLCFAIVVVSLPGILSFLGSLLEDIGRTPTTRISDALAGASLSQTILASESISVLPKMSVRVLARFLDALGFLRGAREKRLNALLAKDGPAQAMAARLQAITEDTAPEIREQAMKLLAAYQSFRDKAEKEKEAVYADLLHEAEPLLLSMQRLIRLHDLEMQQLARTQVTQRDRILATAREIQSLLQSVPAPDPETTDRLRTIWSSSHTIIQSPASPGSSYAGYSRLMEHVGTQQKWIEAASPDVTRVREAYRELASDRLEIIQRFRYAHDELERLNRQISSDWRSVGGELLPILERKKSELYLKTQQWDQREEIHWSGWNMQGVAFQHAQFMEFTKDYLSELDSLKSRVGPTYRQLWGQVNNLLRNSYRLSEEDRRLVVALIQMAKRAEDYATVETLLRLAEKLVAQTAGLHEKQLVQRIIQNYAGDSSTMLADSTSGREAEDVESG